MMKQMDRERVSCRAWRLLMVLLTIACGSAPTSLECDVKRRTDENEGHYTGS